MSKNIVKPLFGFFAIVFFILSFTLVEYYLSLDLANSKPAHRTDFNELLSSPGCTATLPLLKSPDGKYEILIGDEPSKDNFKSNKKVNVVKLPESVSDYSWSSDSKTIAYIEQKLVTLLSVESGEKRVWTNSEMPYPTKVRYSPDGKFLAIAGDGSQYSYEPSPLTIILDAKTFDSVWKKKTYNRPEFAWSKDGRFTLNCSEECMQSFDSRKKFKLCMTIYGMDLRSPIWSPDSKHLAAFQLRDQSLKIFDLNGVLVQSISAPEALEFIWLPRGNEIVYLHQIGMTLDRGCESLRINYGNIQPIERRWPREHVKVEADDKGTLLPRYGYLRRDGKQVLANEFYSINEFKDGSICAGVFDFDDIRESPKTFNFYSRDGELQKFGLGSDYQIVDIDHEFIRFRINPKVTRFVPSRSLMGLCDRSGKIILEPIYFDIWNGGSKTIFAVDANLDVFQFDLHGKQLNHFGRGFVDFREFRHRADPDVFRIFPQIANERPVATIVDSSGKRLPSSSFLYLEHIKKVEPKSLPPGTVFTYSASENLIPYVVRINGEPKFDDSKYRMGFLNMSGSVEIPATFFEVEPFSKGMAVVVVSYDNARKHVGVIDKEGKFVVPPEYSSITTTDLGNFITAKMPEHHYSSSDFRALVRKLVQVDHNYFFGLLREYDLIGMERSKLYHLIGVPEDPKSGWQNAKEVFYGTTYTGSSRQVDTVVFQFENNRVKRWAFVRNYFDGNPLRLNWHSENVMFTFNPNLHLNNESYEILLPKAFPKSDVLKH